MLLIFDNATYINKKYTNYLEVKINYVNFMNQKEKEDENAVENERKKLKDLGVDNTWNILTSGEKKKKEPEKNKVFIGFN